MSGIAAAAAIATTLAGCPPPNKLPACVQGKETPTTEQLALWNKAVAATSVEIAIDGSGSMHGLTGSSEAINAWKALIKGVTLAASTNGLAIQAQRIGNGKSQPISSALQAADPCFFQGCGSFRAVSSSLDSLWKAPGLQKGKPPLRLAISDLEVNDGDISNLLAAIRPHINEGAIIGILGIRLPFEGKVYNSQGRVIHSGKAKRPIYLLATGPRSQVHSLLTEIRTTSALSGAPQDSVELTFLDQQANGPTLLAKSMVGMPTDGASGGLPIRLEGNTYSPATNPDYQFIKLYDNADGVILSSGRKAFPGEAQPNPGLLRLEGIPLSGGINSSINGFQIAGFQLSGGDLSAAIKIVRDAPASVVRVLVPRGQLPEAWWLEWNRREPTATNAKAQSDGLLLLLTSLSNLMVDTGTKPAAAFCLAITH